MARFLGEDPTFRIGKKYETKQIIISGMGDMHLDVIVERLSKKFGVDVNLKTPKVPYKETIRGTSKRKGNKKQSGGRSQYGHVFLKEISPLRGEVCV